MRSTTCHDSMVVRFDSCPGTQIAEAPIQCIHMLYSIATPRLSCFFIAKVYYTTPLYCCSSASISVSVHWSLDKTAFPPLDVILYDNCMDVSDCYGDKLVVDLFWSLVTAIVCVSYIFGVTYDIPQTRGGVLGVGLPRSMHHISCGVSERYASIFRSESHSNFDVKRW